jgi:hypothetical protein
VAQIGVAHEGTCITEPSIDVARNRQLMVAKQVAEHERGSTGECAVARCVSDRRIRDVVGMEGNVVRALLESRGVRQPEQRIRHQSRDTLREIGNGLLRGQ